MAEFRLRLPAFWQFQRRHASTVHVVGIDGIPWPGRVSLEEGNLVIRRNRDESGKVFVSFPFEKRGEITVCTGTLPESEMPYDLVTELARGTLNRLRNQTSIWQEGGLDIPDQVQRLTTEATSLLGRSILSCDRDATADELASKDGIARQSIEKTMDAIFVLCDHFGKKISEFRATQDELPPFWFATTLTNSGQMMERDAKCFDLWQTPSESMLADNSYNLRLIIGPFLDASPGAINGIEDARHPDFDTRKRKIREACHEALAELTEKTSLIHAVCGLNGIGHRHLSFTQQMQMTTEILETIDQSPNRAPVLVSFDCPWAERLASSVGGTHPLQIADSLLRQGGKISFLGLEVDLDYWPGGSVTRDPLQWIDLIDIWSQLGLPLVFCLRVPLRANMHPGDAVVSSEQATVETKQAAAPANRVRQNLSDEQRLTLLDTILPMIIARPAVHGIIWRQWQDTDDARFPFAGISDASGNHKKIVDRLQRIRSQILKRS